MWLSWSSAPLLPLAPPCCQPDHPLGGSTAAAASWRRHLAAPGEQEQEQQLQREQQEPGPGAGAAAVDVRCWQRFRWSKRHSSIYIDDLPHVMLTKPVKVFDFDLAGPVGQLPPREALLEAEVVSPGLVTDVLYWFDLHLDEKVVLNSGPDYVGPGGQLLHTQHNTQPHQHAGNRGSMSSRDMDVDSASRDARLGQTTTTTPSAQPAAAAAAAPDAAGDGAGTTCPASPELPEGATHCPTSRPPPLPGSRPPRTCWGQALQPLPLTAEVAPGQQLLLGVQREGPDLDWALLGVASKPPCPPGPPAPPGRDLQEAPPKGSQPASEGPNGRSSPLAGCTADPPGPAPPCAAPAGGTPAASEGVHPVACLPSTCTATQRPTVVGVGALQPAPRPPWSRPGAGIEDPDVWRVNKCDQLLADCLARVPSGRYPPVWDQLGVLLDQCGALGLDATTAGCVALTLAAQEGLAAAAARQLPPLGPATRLEAAGLDPPLTW